MLQLHPDAAKIINKKIETDAWLNSQQIILVNPQETEMKNKQKFSVRSHTDTDCTRGGRT